MTVLGLNLQKSSLVVDGLISEFDITTQALRHPEQVDLLAPLKRGNQRLDSAHDRVRLQLILRGRRLGFSLPENREILNLYDADSTEAPRRHLSRGTPDPYGRAT